MRLYGVTGLITALLVSGCAVTQPPRAEEDQATPQAQGTAPATAAIQAAPMPTPAAEAFNRQMQAMEVMHQKMQAARTPARRAALLDEQMKLMQSGMAMLGQMRDAAPAAGQEATSMGDMMGMHMQMERRMAMTELMLQMMMDRMSSAPGTKRPRNSK